MEVEEEKNNPLQGVNLNKKFQGGDHKINHWHWRGCVSVPQAPSQTSRMAQVCSWDQQVTSTRGKMP